MVSYFSHQDKGIGVFMLKFHFIFFSWATFHTNRIEERMKKNHDKHEKKNFLIMGEPITKHWIKELLKE